MSEVVFEGAKITGDLIVDNQVASSTASIDNNFANDGKTGPKVKMKNSRAGKVYVKRNGVSIESDAVIPEITVAATVTLISLDGAVTKVTVESSTKLDVQGNANIGQLILTTAVEVALKVKGIVTTLTVNNPTAQITVGAALKINELSIPTGSTAAKIINNYNAIASQILSVIVGNVPSTPTPNPGMPNTGGGSDTSNPPVNNKLNVRTLTELNEAVKIAKQGDTIKLLASITGDLNLTSLVNLDFNGHTLTGNVTITEPAATGTYSLAPTGGTGKITGNLIINAPKVNINIDGLTVEGETVVN